MRLDKFLKVSRLIKRRSVAKEVADKGRILINGKRRHLSGQLNVNGGQMEIVVKDQRGNVLQTQQQPVTASFQQSRSWANRNR